MNRNFNTFIGITNQQLNKYYKGIESMFKYGHIKTSGDGMLLYPNMVIFSESKQHYICEVFGLSEKFSGLSEKIQKKLSTYEYLSQNFEQNDNIHEPLFFLDSHNVTLSRLLLSNGYDKDKITDRFGFSPDEIWGSHLIRKNGVGCILKFGEKFKSLYIKDCCIINRIDELYRMKQISFLMIINKKMNLSEYKNELNIKLAEPIRDIQNLYGIKYIENKDDFNKYNITQFANIFLNPNINETTIGEYLNKNPKIILNGLGYKDMIYEPEFKWIEGGPDDEYKINPDIMMRDNDGFYDIVELKLPKLEKKSITKGKHKRRRFIDNVNEGISQLANYEEYFQFEKNKKYAYEKMGIKVRNNSKKILIIGNYENYNIDEVREASRCLKESYQVIDFDTLNTMIYAKVLN